MVLAPGVMWYAMWGETIAIHGGYDSHPTAKSVAVPIYQTGAYEFNSADDAAVLFDLEVEGFLYSCIATPTNAVLQRRVAGLEGGVGALSVTTGQAALYYSFAKVVDDGGTIVAAPQLYGTMQYCSRRGKASAFALRGSEMPEDIAGAIDISTRAVFCESIGNPTGNICDIEALADIARAKGVALITIATPVLLRSIEYGADVVQNHASRFPI